ncbi:MAG: flagellar hook-basal body protein [Thermoleophilia bacterium]
MPIGATNGLPTTDGNGLLRGIYIAGTGMLAESLRQDVVANNLANATTTGYKRTASTSEPFAAALLRNMAMPGQPEVGTANFGVQPGRLDVINTQGALRSTGNQLDLALVGDGWFTVNTPTGVRYTRDGAFNISADGTLTTKEGYAVMGGNGPVKLEKSGDIGFAEDGTISQNGKTVGKLKVTALAPDSLAKEGANYMNGTATGTAKGSVRQSFLEGSSVNVVSEMVELIRVMRSFEANQKAVAAQDENLAQAISKVGVV